MNKVKDPKRTKTSEKRLEHHPFNEFPPLDFQGIDADQLPEVHVEEEEFIDADRRSADLFAPGGSVKPQTTRNVKQNSFAENQALKSQSNYSEWLNSQRDSRLKGSYHEKLKLDDLNYESKGSSLQKKTMQPTAKAKKNLKIEGATATKRQLIVGPGLASVPSTTKAKNDRNKKIHGETQVLKNQYKTNKAAPKSNHPSFIQGTGSTKQILSSNENTHLGSGQLSGRRALTKKMLGKVVKTSKLDLDPIKRKEAQLSSTQKISAAKLPHKGLGSGRLTTDLTAKKTSERSFKKPTAATSTPLGSPTVLHPSLVPNKHANRQNPYATVQSVMGLQSSAPTMKKTTI